MLGDVNKLFVFKSLLTTPSNVLPSHLEQTFPPIIWIWRWWDLNPGYRLKCFLLYYKKYFQHLTTFLMSKLVVDEAISKMCKKLNFHEGFLSYLLDRTANLDHLVAIYWSVLVSPQKAIVGIKFIPNFCQFPRQVHMKNVVKCWK